MSIINQMLIDLENRNVVTTPIREPIVRDLRTVGSRKNYWLPLLVISLIIIIALTCYLFIHYKQNKLVVSTPALLSINQPVVKKPNTVEVIKKVPLTIRASKPIESIIEKNATLIFEAELKTPPKLDIVKKQFTPIDHAKDLKLIAERVNKQSIKNGESNPKDLPNKFTNQSSASSKSTSVTFKEVRPEQKSANLYRQAILFLQQGRVAEAQTTLSQAIEINPNNHEARQTLAGLLLDNKRNDEARNVLQSGLKLAPEQIGFRMALSRLQLDAGDKVLALATMEQGLVYANNDAEYHGFLATLLQRAERHDEAIQHYQIALSKEPNMISSLVGYGISLQAMGRLSEAQQAFVRAQTNENISPELSQFVEQRLKQINQRLQ